MRVQGVGLRVEGSGCRVQGSGCRVQGSGCRVQGSGCRVQGSECRVQGVGLSVQGAHRAWESYSALSETFLPGPDFPAEERIFIELMTSDHKLETTREGSK